MTLTIPPSLSLDKSVAPFIARANEVATVNPVVSYFCKVYVLEYILSNKLHATLKEIEIFTIQLLDDTESIKKGENDDDESVVKALSDRTISFSIVSTFAYKLFNGCLTAINNYSKSTNTANLIAKLRATVSFLSILSLFADADIDWAKATGGQCLSSEDFQAANKAKIKLIKVNMAKLIRGEIKYADGEDELEKEFEEMEKKVENEGGNDIDETEGKTHETTKELGKEESTKELEETTTEVEETIKKPEESTKEPEESTEEVEETTKESEGTSKEITNEGPGEPFTEVDLETTPNPTDLFPATPSDLPSTVPEDDTVPKGDEDPSLDSLSLPGAPHFAPEESGVLLPGAPKYLPDTDPVGINKKASIQVIPPGKPTKETTRTSNHAPSHTSKQAPSVSSPVNKEDLQEMISKTDQITRVQKLAKFAISALNYEDVETADAELRKALEELQSLRKRI